MADDTIKYSDLITPDDSFERLSNELREISEQYEEMTKTIQRNSQRLNKAVKAGTVATGESSHYAEKFKALTIALGNAQKEATKSVNELTSKFNSQAQASSLANEYLNRSKDSLNALQREIKNTVTAYGNLSDAERQNSSTASTLENNIRSQIASMKELTSNIRENVSIILQHEKAQRAEQNAYIGLNDETVRAQAVASKYRQEVRSVAAAEARAKLLKTQLTGAIVKLTNAEGKEVQMTDIENASYKQLAAQYRVNCDAINRMTEAERKEAEQKTHLISNTQLIINQMKKLQEQVGNTRLNVGNYDGALRNLNFSMAQVIRETPTLLVTVEHWILAISNNLPILRDNIKAVRALNAERRAAGLATQSMLPVLAKSIFNWQTLLIALITALGKWKEIKAIWSDIFSSHGVAKNIGELMQEVNTAIIKNNNSYGEHISKLKRLSDEYKTLSTEAEKQDWIKKHQSAFRELNIDIDNVIDAENILEKNTDKVVEVMMLRAKATAGAAIATDKYKEALVKQQKIETVQAAQFKKQELLKEDKGGILSGNANYDLEAKNRWDYIRSQIKDIDDYINTLLEDETNWLGQKLYGPGKTVIKRKIIIDGKEEETNDVLKILKADMQALEKDAGSMQNYINATNRDMLAKMKEIGLREYYNEKTTGRQRQLKDPWKYIQNENIKAKKAMYDAEAKLEEDELNRQEAQLNANIKKVEEDYNKAQKQLQDFIDGKAEGYRLLTEEEKKIAEDTIRIQIDALNKQKEILVREERLLNFRRALRTNQYTQNVNALYMGTLDKRSVEYKDMQIEQIGLQRDADLIQNAMKPLEQQVSPALIMAKYKKLADLTEGSFQLERFQLFQKYSRLIYDDNKHNSIQMAAFDLEQQHRLIQKRLELHRKGMLDMSDEEVRIAKETSAKLREQYAGVSGARGAASKVSKYGVVGSILSYIPIGKKKEIDPETGEEKVGNAFFNDEQLDAIKQGGDKMLSYLNDIFDAEQEMVEKEIELQQKKVDFYKSAYDAEIQMRANGYAANVKQARLDLELQQQKEADMQKLKEDAQRKQDAINTAMQASELATASATIYKTLSAAGPVGVAIATATIAGMIALFVSSKVKAKQAASQKYGEGGLEFMEGGSHASGHDINLGVKNSRGRTMKVEGGEALAVINKKRTAQYKDILPTLIDSLNKGTFEDKFLNAFTSGENLSLVMNNGNTDLSKLEASVDSIRKQNEMKVFSMPDGTVIMQRKNVKRIIRH